ncbi:TniB family NTP-binding protein [Streptomyces sp. NPDC127110]|uniref:TniB family NTP-binding protein n=1 Tax=Streptomyces sp. NPDC127110 TaxID=3345362 RepID=UPI00363D58EA
MPTSPWSGPGPRSGCRNGGCSRRSRFASRNARWPGNDTFRRSSPACPAARAARGCRGPRTRWSVRWVIGWRPRPTSALLQVGRTCHLAETARTGIRDQVPVAYVLVPPGASAKTLAAEFARFLGIPLTHRMTQAQIMTSVCHTYTQAGVRLVMIDEIHRLNPRTSTGAEATDLLKDLTERIGATFVYAGIDVTSTPLFTGIRGAQLADRATLIDCDTIPARRGTSRPFRDLTAALEACLDLEQHRPGTLPRLAPYLHTRTAGRIGSLARLLRQAAITAILDNTERITKASLEAITLDHLAEDHHRPRYPASPATRRRRNGNSDGPPARAEPA